MPRTAIGNMLRNLAAQHRAAEMLSTTPELVHTNGPDWVRTELSRRQLLGGAAAVAGVVTLGQLPFGHRALAAGAPRIAVVGAGISGLAAALRMRDSGLG